MAKGNFAVNGVNKIVAAYIAATLLVALAAVASLWTFNQIEAASEARKQIAASINNADALLGNLVDAETSQRGFALTGDESFLQPYLSAQAEIRGQLQELRSRAQARPSLKHLDALAPLVDIRLTELAEIIKLRRSQDFPAVVAMVSSSRSKQTMDLIRSEVRSFTLTETRELEQQHVDFDSNMRRMFAIIVAICLLALVLAVAFAYLAYRETQHRLKALVHQETQHLLNMQEDVNKQLQSTNTNLHISEERLAVTLNSIDDAVIATDAKGRVTLLNPLAEKLTGWTRAEAFNRPVEEIFHLIDSDTRQPYTVPVRETLEHGTTLGLANHTIVIARDGTECHIADSCAPIRDRKGQVVGAVLVFRDVTERKRLDQVLHEKNTELERTKAIAERANLAKSDFLSSMSHELRTPLSAILGFAQLMDSAVPPPTIPQKRSIDQILKAGWYLLELINEILDLALIESGKLSLSIEPLSLADVMRECQTMVEPQAKVRGIAVTFPRLQKNYFVKADRTRVKQILINLLSNAIKYNKADGTIVVECNATTPQRVRMSVRDTGAGLSPEKLMQLFQPFNRLGQEANGEEGTGIGLVVCKRLTELMGGAIGAESTVGKGSVFWIELNLTAEPPRIAGATHHGAGHAQGQGVPGVRSHTLLYVEDNPANLLLVEDIIARRPEIHLLSARDGITGVKMAHTSLPDVILMDINLPGINGIQALQMLMDSPATAHIPVVALSANAMPRDIERGLDAGFFRYLTKPIKVNEFMTTLDTAFKFAKTHAGNLKPEAKT
jgi:PAS domain S-box-containing protein